MAGGAHRRGVPCRPRLIHLADIFRGHVESPVRDLAVVVIPAIVALYASLPNKEFAMRKWFARRYLQRYRSRYNYDTSYMEMVLDEAPDAFFKFAKIFGIANYRKVVPVDAIYAAKITGAMHEDCGPCTQLVSTWRWRPASPTTRSKPS